jgi:hypothetical protein
MVWNGIVQKANPRYPSPQLFQHKWSHLKKGNEKQLLRNNHLLLKRRKRQQF